MSPNNGTLLDGVLMAKLMNIFVASWFLTSLDFLLPYFAHFDNKIVLLLIVFGSLGFMFSVSFLHFKR